MKTLSPPMETFASPGKAVPTHAARRGPGLTPAKHLPLEIIQHKSKGATIADPSGKRGVKSKMVPIKFESPSVL